MVAIFLMAVPPLYEFIDKGRDMLTTGNDAPLTVIVIGVCVGLCFGMASLIVRLIGFVFSFVGLLSNEMALASRELPHTPEYERLLFSPPLKSLTSLRI